MRRDFSSYLGVSVMRVYISNQNIEGKEELTELCEIVSKIDLDAGDHLLYNQQRYEVLRHEYNVENYNMKLIVLLVTGDLYQEVPEVKECRFCGQKACHCT